MKINGPIPLRIYPIYWISSALLSLLMGRGDLLQSLLWMAIIFISVLFHELGHALTAKMFGRNPRVELVAMGGVTYHDGEKLSRIKQFFVTLDGPLFGFILAFGTGYLSTHVASPTLQSILAGMSYVNYIWTAINLLPVLPLDGGQLLRMVFEKWFRYKGLGYALLVGGVFALIGSLIFFAYHQIFGGALFFLFAFDNIDNYRKNRHLKDSDSREELKTALADAETLFRQGYKEEALNAFQAIRESAKEGVIYEAATQYAAVILDDLRQSDAAYVLLKPLQRRLDPPSLLLLHRLFFERQEDKAVATIGASVFQSFPFPEVALRNAYAMARLNQPRAAIGWLQTAKENGVENLQEIVREPSFNKIRKNADFKGFIQNL